MQDVTKNTLAGIFSQMAAHGWSQSEIDELLEPRMGVITGLQDLLNELEEVRKIDLGTVPPAMGVRNTDTHD